MKLVLLALLGVGIFAAPGCAAEEPISDTQPIQRPADMPMAPAAGAVQAQAADGPIASDSPRVGGGLPRVRFVSPYAAWENGPPKDPKFFPIAVWLQGPRSAPKYKAIGINTYIGLHNGPTEEQLAELKRHGMLVICHLNEVGLKHKDDKNIIAWMHGDEPDNAHSTKDYWKSNAAAMNNAWPDMPPKTLEQWGGWGPPVPPSKIIADYREIKRRDPSRPVFINLGQGVAWDGWVGRGVRTNQPGDYKEYAKGADIVSYDIYPANQDKPAVKDQHWMVPFGVERLIQWTDGKKPIWNVVECTGYGGPEGRPEPEEVRSQVWMSIIQGSRGIVYFVHVFKPQFIEAGLLADKEMAEAVGKLNKQITELAPVINSPDVAGLATVTSSNEKTPLKMMVKQHEGAIYLFVAAFREGPTKASFTVKTVQGLPVEVLGEDRKLTVGEGGKFQDEFSGYGVHIYRIALPRM